VLTQHPIRVLATDLDGTFLGGSAAARRALTVYFRDHPDRRLLYVTGRSSRSVMELVTADVLPAPDAMICDVGSFIATADGTPVESAVMHDIQRAWDDRSDQVRSAFARLEGLRLQAYFGPYRVSYYYDTPAILPQALQLAHDLGCDGLTSDGRFFDVLPRGVNKGTTLQRLMHAWAVPTTGVLVAGDTLNDLSMLTSGFPAVAVGNAEAALIPKLPMTDLLVRAEAHGTDGIVEALSHFGVEIARA
jgi:hydroxymethylpyrimidine pyrophosphatase-like HAD family hydrolase